MVAYARLFVILTAWAKDWDVALRLAKTKGFVLAACSLRIAGSLSPDVRP